MLLTANFRTMKKSSFYFTLVGTWVLTLLSAYTLKAQSVSGPEILCQGQGGYYYFADDVQYTNVEWYQDGSFLGTGNSKYLTWNSSGSVNVTVYNNGTFLYQTGMSVSVKTPGYITADRSTVCPGTLVTVRRNESVGTSFSWFAKPVNQSNWTSLGTGSTASFVVNMETDFRLVLNDCSPAQYTDYKVRTHPPQTGGTIGTGTTVICHGTVPGNIDVFTNATGESSSFEWQASTDNVNWSKVGDWRIPLTFTQPLYVTTHFRRVVTGCGVSVPSNTVTIRVDQPSYPGTLTVTGADRICHSGSVSLSTNGSNITKWRYRTATPNGAWSAYTEIVSSATTRSFSVDAFPTSVKIWEFSVLAKNGVYPELPSNNTWVWVHPNTQGGSATVSGPSEAYGSTSGTISSSGSVGTVSLYEESNDGRSWATRFLTNPQNYSITQSKFFRVVVTDPVCPQSVSAPVFVEVYPTPVIMASGNTTLLPGSSITLSVGRYFSYQWSKDGQDIPGANGPSLAVSTAGQYRVRVQGRQGSSLSPTTSSPVTVSVAYGISGNLNAAVVTQYAKPGLSSSGATHGHAAHEVAQTITYMDGLGRDYQQVAVGFSPRQTDLIQPYAYNKLGQVTQRYLPYARSSKSGNVDVNALKGANGQYTSGSQYSFYQSAEKVARDLQPYATTVYESSPVERITEQGAPGATWQPGSSHTVRNQFHVMTSQSADQALKNVRNFTLTGPSGFFPDLSLAISKTTDENGNNTWLFVDKLGRTVLKRVQLDENVEGAFTSFLETYYVYDDRGNIALIVPPKAIDKISRGTAWSTTFRDEWCFVYSYDHFNRLVEKKVPGSAAMYFIYDRFDRLVLSQDGFLRATNKWMFIKYDHKGRPVMTGLYRNTTHTTRTAVQANVLDVLYTSPDPVNYTGTPYFEGRGNSLHGYTNQSFPTANSDNSALEVFAVNYFDSYDFDNNGTADFSYTAQGISGEGTQGSAIGLPTGNKRLVLNTSTWLHSYQFYDRDSRVIQVRSNNQLSAAIDNLATTVYNFDGTVNTTKNYHNGGGTNQVTVVNKFTYDHARRLLKIRQQVNNDAEVIVADYRYNDLGQLVEKNLHCSNCPDPDPMIGQAGVLTGANLVLPPYQNEVAAIASASVLLQNGFAVNGARGPFVAKIGQSAAQANAIANANSLQSIDYRYNIRGWLTSINNSELRNDSGTTNDDGNDLFGIELDYANSVAGLGNTPFYNGNISAVRWKSPFTTPGSEDVRSYKYAYDKSDRLKSATYQKKGTSTWDRELNALNEVISYDANGNILTMQRNRIARALSAFSSVVSAFTFDNLSYTYASGSGNQLTKVEDSANAEGFANNSTAATEYTYDTNGSLLTDLNKGLSGVVYNALGKPQQMVVNGKTLTYLYDGAGNKLRVTVNQGSTSIATDYVGGFVYEGGVLKFFGSPEGRVVKTGNSFEYQYAIADHQGNTRVLVSSKPQPADTYTATFEDNTLSNESSTFQNYPTGGARSSFELFDHTDFNGTTYTR